MNVTSVRVTLVEEGGWTDVSVAAGTPLRALLEARTGAAVPDNALVSTASGTPAPLDAVFGRDLEDGAMLLVGGRRPAGTQPVVSSLPVPGLDPRGMDSMRPPSCWWPSYSSHWAGTRFWPPTTSACPCRHAWAQPDSPRLFCWLG